MRRYLGSSLTKKLVVSLAGLFLILFLLVHLAINLFLLKSDPSSFNNAAHFMASNIVIKIFEVILLLLFAVHIVGGIVLQIQNWMARPTRYNISNHSQTSYFSKYMIYLGTIIFIFLFIHFLNFYFVKIGLIKGNADNFYAMAHDLFKSPLYLIIYIVSFLILSFHLNHAFQSAFQTLGLNHRKYTPGVKAFGLFYSVMVPAGFTAIPVIIFFFK
ncbi:MAG TPA: succinate dehydrogenase cytochrome b subunit [Myxococcota bacterium]|nr:succinate dehydrogenase cytochrome b subunit [Myxococcota bacterium]